MRAAYLVAGLVVAALVIFNAPRLPWITTAEIGAVGPFRGFAHGMIGMSYMGSWVLIIGGLYQLILGVVYWDMDTTEAERWAFTMDSGGTAKLLFVLGALCLAGGIAWAAFAYTHDNFVVPAGIASTVGALLACWLLWLAFPLMEQVGIDRESMGV
jgi:hypothetical protein